MLKTKCKTLIKLLLSKLNEENGVGIESFTSSQQFHHYKPLPTCPWTHNNNEAITICVGICNMESVGIFYQVPWRARFLKLYRFPKGINIPLVHLLHGGIEMNCK
jgi:hypothetical protein